MNTNLKRSAWVTVVTTVLLLGAAYLVAAQVPGGSPLQPPQGVDLDVTYISRTPTYHRYCVEYPDQTPQLCAGTESEKRWPEPGEVVTFTAHIVNQGTQASGAFSYTWSIDGTSTHTGTLPGLDIGAEITTTYPWTWAHTLDGERLLGQHSVGFTVDPQGAIAETFENNNSREDRTDALSLAIFFEQGLYDDLNQVANGLGTYSSEDWIQWQVAQMNERFAQAVYTTTSPQGILTRVRVDHIEVCTDVSACMAAHDPRAQDGRWQFLDTSGYISTYADRIDWGLIHELGHQIGLIDLYRMNVADWMNGVPDSRGDPLWGIVSWPYAGLMGGGDRRPYDDDTYFSSHSAAGLNSHHGYRRGYYGDYLFDVPLTTTLVILDGAGLAVPGATVELFQKTAPPEEIPSTPVITGQSDGQGHLAFPDRPAQGHTSTRTGHTLRDTPFGFIDVCGPTGIFIGRIRARGHEEFFRYDITAANLAYWSGLTGTHVITLTTHIPPLGAPAPPPVLQAERIEDRQVTLTWSASPSSTVSGYNVYRASRPDWVYRPIVTGTTPLSYTDALGDWGKYHYAVTAVDGAGRESGFSPVARAPHLVRPWGVAITPQGDRVIAENHHGRLLLQHSDGRYVGFFNRWVGVWGRGLDVDKEGNILVAEARRHCIHHFDAQGNHVGTIGDCSSDEPGRFEWPSDVAIVPPTPFQLDVPLTTDAHTLLLCHFDGDVTCEDGETGSGAGFSFQSGQFDRGVLLDDGDTLTYPTAGNLITAQGGIEFWVQPTWEGDDDGDHAFVETSGGWYNRLRIAKDAANNLRFIVWDASAEYDLGYSIARWQPGEWHHIAALWTSDQMKLVVDGDLVGTRTSAPPETLGDTLYIGSSNFGGHPADAVIDEMRISDVPRVGHAPAWEPYVFVADTGHHQIQAFDRWHLALASFGTFGSDPGQFSDPEGIAVAPDGRVIVADTGNDRLQVLTFEGGQFSTNRVITAELSAPGDVAADPLGRIVVADTGNDVVKVLDASGELVDTFAEPDAPYSGPFDAPRGIAVGRLGRVVIADTGRWRVVTVSLDVCSAFLPIVLRDGP